MGGNNYVTTDQLADIGLTPQDVRRRYPWVVEYTALDDTCCWLRQDLAELLHEPEREDQP